MKSPACRLAHGLQFAISSALVAVSYAHASWRRVLHELVGDETTTGVAVALPREVQPVVVGAAVSFSVSSHARRRSTWAFGFVSSERRHRVVVDDADLRGVRVEWPEFLDAPNRSGSSVVPPSGTCRRC